jgi:hypothetical protein
MKLKRTEEHFLFFSLFLFPFRFLFFLSSSFFLSFLHFFLLFIFLFFISVLLRTCYSSPPPWLNDLSSSSIDVRGAMGAKEAQNPCIPLQIFWIFKGILHVKTLHNLVVLMSVDAKCAPSAKHTASRTSWLYTCRDHKTCQSIFSEN